MKKKISIRTAQIILIVLIAAAILLPQLIGTVNRSSVTEAGSIVTLDDLNGRSFVSVTGSAYDDYIRKYYPESPVMHVSDWADMELAVAQGKADALVSEESSLQEKLDAYDELVVLPVPLDKMDVRFLMSKDEKGQEIAALFNEYLAEITADGTAEEMLDKWSDAETAPDHVEPAEMTGESRGTLRIGSCLDWAPFCYLNNGEPCGYFIELGLRFCAWAGYTPEIEYSDVQGTLAGFESGRFDMLLYGFTYSDERAERSIFSEPVYSEPVYVVLNRENTGFHTTGKTLQDMAKKGARITGQSLTEPLFMAQETYPEAEFQDYPTLAEVYYAVSSGKADYGLSYVDNFPMVEENYDDLAFIRTPMTKLEYAFAMQKTDEGAALRDEYNAFYREIKQSGVLDAIIEKWESADPAKKVMDSYSYSGEKGTLKVATCGTWEPYSYYVGTELSGKLVELACLFCQENGYTPDFYIAPYASEITGLLSGEYDILADAVTINEERRESTDLTDPFLASYVMIVTKADVGANADGTVSKASVFFSDLKTSFEKNFIRESRWKMILSGLGVTVSMAILAGVIGTALGCGICAMRMSRQSFVTGFARLYIKIIQGTPIVVLLMVLYYLIFGKTDMQAFWVCVIGFSMDFAAYASEIFRSGLEAVPEGQKRAAKALGFSKTKAFNKVVLPQAMIHILPVFSGQFIAMVKLTSVAGYISVQDLTKISDIIRSRTYEAFFPLISTAVIYFVIATLLVSLLKLAERRIDPALRNREIKGVSFRAD